MAKTTQADDYKETSYSATAQLVTASFIYKVAAFVDDKGVTNATSYQLKKDDKVKITKKSTTGFYEITSDNSTNHSGWISMQVVNILNSKGKVTDYANKKSVEYLTSVSDIKAYKEVLTADLALNAISLDRLSADDKLSAASAKKVLLKNLNGIHGVPYQFMESVDMRHDSTLSIGRKYTERILSKMPLLLMTPGSPDFLSNYSTKEKDAIVDKLVNGTKGVSTSNLKKILNTSGRYYTFKFNYSDYYGYVNGMLHMCAIYLGIQNEYHGNGYGKGYCKKLGEFRWENAVNHELR
jgi:hypothetical protein